MLDAVLCPLLPREVDQAVANLEFWARECLPGQTRASAKRVALIYQFPFLPAPEHIARIDAVYAAHTSLHGIFSNPEYLSSDLKSEDDQYVGAQRHNRSAYGFASGPNLMFFHGLFAMRRRGVRFYLLMEVDTLPLRFGWIDSLAKVVKDNEDAWVLGSPYLGGGPLDPSIRNHINGNALYHSGADDFARFLHGIYLSWYARHIAEDDPTSAFDVGWERFIEDATRIQAPSELQCLGRMVMSKRRQIPQIVSIASAIERQAGVSKTRKDILANYPAAVIAHGVIAGEPQEAPVDLVASASLVAARIALAKMSGDARSGGAVVPWTLLGGADGAGRHVTIHPTEGFDGIALYPPADTMRLTLTLRCSSKVKFAIHTGDGNRARRTCRPILNAFLPFRLSAPVPVKGPVFVEVMKVEGGRETRIELLGILLDGRTAPLAREENDVTYARSYLDGPWQMLLKDDPVLHEITRNEP